MVQLQQMTYLSNLSDSTKLAPHSSIQTVEAPKYKQNCEVNQIVNDGLVRRAATAIMVEDDEYDLPV